MSSRECTNHPLCAGYVSPGGLVCNDCVDMFPNGSPRFVPCAEFKCDQCDEHSTHMIVLHDRNVPMCTGCLRNTLWPTPALPPATTYGLTTSCTCHKCVRHVYCTHTLKSWARGDNVDKFIEWCVACNDVVAAVTLM